MSAPAATQSGRVRALLAELGRTLAEDGRAEEALSALDRARAEPGTAPADVELWLATARLHADAGAADAALTAAAKALRTEPGDWEPVAAIAHGVLDERTPGRSALLRLADSVGGALRVLDGEPGATRALRLLAARLAVVTGELDRAEEHLRAAASGDGVAAPTWLAAAGTPTDDEPAGDAALRRARLLAALGCDAEALAATRDALALPLSEPLTVRAHALAGELLDSAGAHDEAADQLYEAGRQALWDDEPAVARALLERAAGLGPQLQPVFFYLAEATRLAAAQEAGGNPGRESLEEALRIWERGRALGPVPEDQAWAHLARAAILDALAEVSADPTALLWEELCGIEQALALAPDWSDAWRWLGRVYGQLQEQPAALHATELAGGFEDATEADRNDYLLAHVSLRGTAALDVLDEQLAQLDTDDPWLEGVTGYLRTLAGDLDGALIHLDRALEADPSNVMNRMFRGQLHLAAGRADKAEADLRAILAVPDDGDAPHIVYHRGAAAYHLGDLATAETQLRRRLAIGGPSMSAHLLLAFTLAASGRAAEADPHLDDAIATLDGIMAAEDALFDIELARRGGDVGLDLDALRARVEAEHERLAQRTWDDDAVLERLEALAATVEDGAETDDARAVALLAGSARMLTRTGRWRTAEARWAALARRAGDGFPEAEARRFEAALAYADELFVSARLDEFGALLSAETARAEERGDGTRLATLHARAALLAAAHRQLHDAVEHTLCSLELRRDAGDVNPSGDLVRTLDRLIDGIHHPVAYTVLDEALALAASRAGFERDERVQVRLARLELARRRFPRVVAKGASERQDDTLSRAPIQLNAAPELWPGGGEHPEVRRLLDHDIDDLRERIRETRGVVVPTIILSHRTDQTRGGYRIDLYGSPIAEGTVRVGGRFCLPDEGTPTSWVAKHPLTGAAGYWSADPGADGLDPSAFMLAHLEAVLQRRLSSLVGLQQLHQLVREWVALGRPGARELADAFAADPRQRARFLRMLRALLDDGAPIDDVEQLAGGFLEGLRDGRDLTATTEAVLARVGSVAAHPGAVALPDAVCASLMERLRADGDRPALVLDRPGDGALAAEVLDAAWQAADDGPPRVAAPAALRPYVKRLLATAAPRVPVAVGIADGGLR